MAWALDGRLIAIQWRGARAGERPGGVAGLAWSGPDGPGARERRGGLGSLGPSGFLSFQMIY